MILNNYERFRKVNNFSLTRVEIREAYECITKLLQYFQELTDKRVSKAEMIKAFHDNAELIKNTALFLLDHQGAYDDRLSRQIELVDNFAGLVFIMNIPFYGAEHRLLEITKNYKMALCSPEKDNIALFIMANLRHYTAKDYDVIVKRWHFVMRDITIIDMPQFLASPFTALYNLCKN